MRSGVAAVGRREAHIRALCAEHDIHLDFHRRHASYDEGGGAPVGGSASMYGTVTLASPSWSRLAYFAALHEVAHIVYRDPMEWGRYHENEVEYEARAWLWALDHAMEPPSQLVRDTILTQWLGSYLGHGRPQHHYAGVCARLGVTR